MPPELAHLPDLPDAGYQTRREKQLSDAVMFLMRALERDRLMLLDVVLDGPAKWRKTVKNAWRAFRMDDEMADAMYRYLTIQAAQPWQQRELLDATNRHQWRRVVRAMWPDLEAQRAAVARLTGHR